ncbi:MAG: calcium-binding protein [Leptolyngbyaceae cyanobacterium bins.302]|nr:calcium-binding protein [Leptolyngbyaceae cyanobacterium bins.302]
MTENKAYQPSDDNLSQLFSKFLGNSGGDRFQGTNGDDLLIGNGGNDALQGAEGDDLLISGDPDNAIPPVESILPTELPMNSVANAAPLTVDAPTIVGTDGHDTLQGTDRNDVVDGGKGDDILHGGAGDDRLLWNPGGGSDIVNGGDGTDVSVINGGNEGEFFALGQNAEGKAVLDRLSQTPFNVTAESTEQFEVNAGTGNDFLDVNQLLDTGVQSLKFSGGEGNDILSGAGTNIALNTFGDTGDDILIGGSGDDNFTGGAGNDLTIGNGGKDLFIFDTGAVFSAAEIGVDTLTDFTTGEDKIVLDKNTFASLQSEAGHGFSAASEFATVQNDAESVTSDALIVYSAGSGKLFYNSNGAEDGFGRGAEFATIAGASALTAEDFVVQI